MKKLIRVFVVSMTFVFLSSLNGFTADKGNFSTAPKTNNGKKWRIGFYEGGDYIDYQSTLTATVNGMITLGWIEKIEIPKQESAHTSALWKWLSANVKSNYLEFPADAHYSANWDDELRKKMAEDIINRLNNKKDIDLMIASGTWAGQDLANNKHQTPVIVVSTSDPLKAGIIKSIEDSGNDYIHARVDPLRYKRQVELFHEVAKFKTLGIAYENTEAGRSYGAVDMVENTAQERGFEVVSCYTQSDIPDKTIAQESVKKCFEEFAAKKVDAIYVTAQRGINSDNISELANIANKNKIPTFSQPGSKFVENGLLMSVAKAGFQANGIFHAQTIAKVFNGAKPRQLEQVLENPQKIAINEKTAEILQFKIPIEFVEIIDEVYN
ncbi:putative ABC transporter, solute-binding protein [Desulfonema limicola]|uniref:ABC transporter, solute-binding protein n=1 Tax=Desulfonema limicola TaxID=45656 RepID=A0A975B9Z1_9BACT|nr:ABC transporter substrate binding protein [Desulfonema limicola]QTA81517.1 putative ABC transporter, solute-binding protein [Desulfonema limicola]